MNDPRDPLEELRLLAQEQARTDQPKSALRTSLAEQAARDRHHRRGRRLAGVLVGVTIVGSAAAGVTAFIASRQPARPEIGVACHAVPLMAGQIVAVAATVDPIGACAQAWRDGQFEMGGPQRQAPPLIACIGPAGNFHVFPDLSDCSVLGLSSAANIGSDGATYVKLQTWVVEELNLGNCVTSSRASEMVRAKLHELGLQSWSITTLPSATASTCVKAEVDVPAATVTIFSL